MTTNQQSTSHAKDSFAATFEQSALIDIKRVRQLLGVQSNTGIYNKIRAGQFPQPVKLSARCTRFHLREVVAWIEAKSAGQRSEA